MEICREVRSQKDDGQGTDSARSARMMNDEGRLALVETICAQRSELFNRNSSIVLPYIFPFGALSANDAAIFYRQCPCPPVGAASRQAYPRLYRPGALFAFLFLLALFSIDSLLAEVLFCRSLNLVVVFHIGG